MQNNTFSGESRRQNLIVLDELGSTNDYLKSELANFKPLPEWSAIMARHQTAGRGQRDSTWTVEPKSNLTFSFVLYPDYLNLQDHFTLNMLISLGIHDWLISKGITPEIKWPNDILINHKKVCGILIENKSAGMKIKQSVVGIGVNVNQKQFFDGLENTASSLFKETGITTENLEEECLNLLAFLQNRIENFKNKKLTTNDLLKTYNNFLFLRDKPARYASSDITFQAILRKVDANGQLYLEQSDGIKTYFFKEVRFLMQ